jgi:hypothetical protein
MQYSSNSYPDFLNVVRRVGGAEAIFYWAVSESDFRIFVILDGGSTVMTYPASTAAKPSTFDADFPEAIALSASLNITN